MFEVFEEFRNIKILIDPNCLPTDWVGRNCHISKGGCEFDYGFEQCGYETYPVIDYLWKSNSGSTPNFNTGPESDHTTGQGNFLLIFIRKRNTLIFS